jgi:hypothetical protein
MCNKISDTQGLPDYERPKMQTETVETERPRLDLDLDHVFSYHAPTPFQQTQYEVIRAAAKTLAAVIEANTPRCADRQAAIRHVREAVMTANAAIALRGRLSR